MRRTRSALADLEDVAFRVPEVAPVPSGVRSTFDLCDRFDTPSDQLVAGRVDVFHGEAAPIARLIVLRLIASAN